MFSLRSFLHLRTVATSISAAVGLFVPAAGVLAQESVSGLASNLALTITPRISITETLTDNVRLSSVDRQSEQITEVSPGIRIIVNGARLKGYFDYSLNEVVYAKNSSPRRTLNSLNSFGTLEAIQNWAFVDFSGLISRQAISAFGNPLIDNTSINTNQAEVATYRLSPYIRGRIGDLASYEARYSRTITRTDAVAGSGVTTTDAVGRISGDSAFRNLGWRVDASQQSVDYTVGRPTKSDRLSLGLSYMVTPQLNIFANAGREANNYISLDKQSYGTRGFGVRWAPSERTSFSASREYLSFGNGHNVSVNHRTARTAWRLSDTKGILTTPTQAGNTNQGLTYDILFSQFASIEPDPVLRAQLVNAFLQTNGINPNTSATRGFLTSAVTLERRQDLLLALLGVRDTITFIGTRSESRRLDTLSTGVDDLTTSSLVRQRGFSVNFSHRLTPDYSLGVLASQQNTSGSSTLQDTTLRLFNVNLTGRVGRKSFASLGVRHTNASTGGIGAYVENAVFTSLTVQF